MGVDTTSTASSQDRRNYFREIRRYDARHLGTHGLAGSGHPGPALTRILGGWMRHVISGTALRCVGQR